MPGQYPMMLLSEMGADVIKVEAPGIRSFIFETIHGEAATPEAEQKWEAACALDRGKRSIVLNLRSEAAREIFHQLARKSDVVLESNRPGVMKRLGIDYDTVKEMNPGIIYCAITGYGQDGPYSTLPARDLDCVAVSGILGVLNEGGLSPIVPGLKIADLAGAMYTAIGVLLALAAREKTGRGQFIDISMTDGALSWLTAPLMLYFETGKVPDRDAVFLSGKWPSYNVYQAKDGKYISIATREAHIWERLCKKLGREDLLPYRNPGGRKKEEIISIFRDIFATKTRDEWFEELKDVGVARAYQLDELASDPQFIHREMFVEVDHPRVGKVKQVGNPIKLSDTPGKVKGPAPSLGQHTDEILRELGYSPLDIENLRRDGVVK
jgi:Predicted acyl-CoA transferases/carnitine dehydratase